MRQTEGRGFILVTSLIITTLFVFLVTYLSYRTTTFISFAKTSIDREKAYALALGGIQIGMSQLVPPVDQEKQKEQAGPKQQKEQKKQAEQAAQSKALLTSILPPLNRWQAFELREDVDGLDGEIKVCIASEDGKIDINAIYDFKKHAFLGEGKSERNWKTGMKILFARIEQAVGAENLFDSFEQFLKKRNKPVDDITELINAKGFDAFKNKLFYQPPTTGDTKHPIFLTDLFTVWSLKPSVQPWLFSDSICAILGLQRAKDDDIDKRSESVQQWLRDFKLNVRWSADWDNLMIPLYGKDYNSLPKNIDTVLSSQFEPHFFSILSVGKYGEVEQRLLAIVQKVILDQKNKQKFDIKIRKLYWL